MNTVFFLSARQKIMTHKKMLIVFLCFLIFGITIYSKSQANVPNFASFKAGPERKEVFFTYFLPMIQQQNQKILKTRDRISTWKQNRTNIGWIDSWQVRKLAKSYQMKTFNIESTADWNTLLNRVDIIPPSLALAQAANESGWGSSRFARNGYNYFGQWCFKKGCGIVPNERKPEKIHEVTIFNSPEKSVQSYMHNLNSHYAYQGLRKIRADLQAKNKPVTGLILATSLGKYSEQGAKYIKDIQTIIRFDNLLKYDTQESLY